MAADKNVNINEIKKNPLAVAVLLDVAYYKKRTVSEIEKDLQLKGNEKEVLHLLDANGFLTPNPHRNVADIKYILATKGYFLVNELKAENPKLLENIRPELVHIVAS